MASTIPPTFTCFPRFPLELQEMVWEEAAADLPVLDIQRFTAEITMTDQHTNSAAPQRPLLCFTPHADFIDSTTGHRGLLRACRDSREAAQAQIDHLLPIHYLTTDATGSLVARQASVPFNSSGHFCVSGLALAIEEATEGRGARGSRLPRPQSEEDIIREMQDLGKATTSLIKNLTISLVPAQGPAQERSMCRGDGNRFLRLFGLDGMDLSEISGLKTVSLIGEGVLNGRHHIAQRDFDLMHRSLPVLTVAGQGWLGQPNAWYELWMRCKHEQWHFIFVLKRKIREMEPIQSQSDSWAGRSSLHSAAHAARKKELELTLSAIME